VAKKQTKTNDNTDATPQPNHRVGAMAVFALVIMAMAACGLINSLGGMFGDQYESADTCCAGEADCGTIVELPDSENFLIENYGRTSVAIYMCRADGTPAEAFREPEDSTAHITDDGEQIAIAQYWQSRIRYYDIQTLDFDRTVQCEERPTAATCPIVE
jgi:hypothetical protein